MRHKDQGIKGTHKFTWNKGSTTLGGTDGDNLSQVLLTGMDVNLGESEDEVGAAKDATGVEGEAQHVVPQGRQWAHTNLFTHHYHGRFHHLLQMYTLSNKPIGMTDLEIALWPAMVIGLHGSGACVSTTCNFCRSQSTSHYCRATFPGAKGYIQGSEHKKIRGLAMCIMCWSKWGTLEHEMGDKHCISCIKIF